MRQVHCVGRPQAQDAGVRFVWAHNRREVRAHGEAALRGWASKDPKAAIAWTIENEGESRVLKELVDSMVSLHPAQAEELLALPGLRSGRRSHGEKRPAGRGAIAS